LAEARVNEAAGRIQPASRQLAISVLEYDNYIKVVDSVIVPADPTVRKDMKYYMVEDCCVHRLFVSNCFHIFWSYKLISIMIFWSYVLKMNRKLFRSSLIHLFIIEQWEKLMLISNIRIGIFKFAARHQGPTADSLVTIYED
jgi:hypothetical protein